MKTVKKSADIQFYEKKSKFIGYVKSVGDRKSAEEFIGYIRSRHSDATHNVYAYKIFDNQEIVKFSDDGEPQNTGGKPIIELINIKGLSNVVVVVTRYFGGIKLGASGLIRNYAKAAKLALEKADEEEIVEKKKIMIEFNYDKINIVENILNKFADINNLEKDYGEKIIFRLKATGECIRELEKTKDLLVVSLDVN